MDKKEELLINVAKIINEEGMQKLTIEYVAQKSDITKGGVLYHFKNKEQLILKMNEMVIAQYEASIQRFEQDLSGDYRFTRAYALATLDVLKDPEPILLSAVLISSQENKKSEQLWIQVSQKWNAAFQQDEGEEAKKLKLRMICDGAWFSMMYQYGGNLKEELIGLIEQTCKTLEKVGE